MVKIKQNDWNCVIQIQRVLYLVNNVGKIRNQKVFTTQKNQIFPDDLSKQTTCVIHNQIR